MRRCFLIYAAYGHVLISYFGTLLTGMDSCLFEVLNNWLTEKLVQTWNIFANQRDNKSCCPTLHVFVTLKRLGLNVEWVVVPRLNHIAVN